MRALVYWLVLGLLAGCASNTAPAESEGQSNGTPDTPQDANGPSSGPDQEPRPRVPDPSGGPTNSSGTNDTVPDVVGPNRGNGLRPSILMGTHDHSLNVYHEAFYRPDRIQHPCTYTAQIPCTVESLNLSVGLGNVEQAMNADSSTLESMEAGKVYWIPRTIFVAISCSTQSDGRACLLPGPPEQDNGHGTSTVSSAISEAPQALMAFVAGAAAPNYLHNQGINVDIMWSSQIPAVPLPTPQVPGIEGPWDNFIQVQGAGNTPAPTLVYGQIAHPQIILVGGAHDDGAGEAASGTIVDVVSHYCRPVASAWSTREWVTACGTSFSAPTVAGTLGDAILQVRQESGYVGGLDGDLVDVTTGISIQDVRQALNLTATYDPEPRFEEDGGTPIPHAGPAPYLQWGWGFMDSSRAGALVKCLTGDCPPAKDPETQEYMAAIHELRRAYYG